MKKQYLTALFLSVGLLAISAGAWAQEEGKIVANIPYEFVAGGITLPAGTYTIARADSPAQNVLQIRNKETSHDTAFLLPISTDASAIHRAGVSLERLGDTYYLTGVATSAGSYTLSTSKTPTAKLKQHDATQSVGTN
jgi:hypothetical protein